jgi:uncharacterized membrane protein
VNEIEVSRRVDRPPTAVFPVLRDFAGYPEYSTYLERVRRTGGSGQKVQYALQFGWWRLSYETHTRILELDPPRLIKWEVTSALDANGHWRVSEQSDGNGSILTLRIEYNPESLAGGSVSLPIGISLDWVREKVEPMIQNEARQVLDRIAADVESEPTP